MCMLPGLIKQLVLSKPIYGRMELQRSEFNIYGGRFDQMLFREGVKKHIFYGHADRKRLTPTPPLLRSAFYEFFYVFIYLT